MVDLVVSVEQQQIIDSVADYLGSKLPVARLRPDAKSPSEMSLWSEMGALGWFMMALPESAGGVGLGEVEEALVFRQLGRHLLSPNVIASAIGARVAAARGQADLALAIAAGRTRVALANPIGPVAIGERVDGRFQAFDAEGADWLLVLDDAGSAALAPREAIRWRTLSSAIDGVTLHEAILAGARCPVGAPATFGGYVLLRLLAASMLAGLCEGARDLASEYAKVRQQFGQPIGAFQAIKHKCSDMALRADATGALVNFASITVAARRDDAEFQATAAKLLGGQYALLSGKEVIQVHGGIGFTVECDAHHFLKRAHLYDQIGGGVRRQQRLLLAQPAPEMAA